MRTSSAEFTKGVDQNGSVPSSTTRDTSAEKIQTVALNQTTPAATKQSLTMGKEFAIDIPSADLTVDQANKQLDAVKQ